MRNHPIYQKAKNTNKLTKEEAISFFEDLYKDTEAKIKKDFPGYVKEGRWPLKARVPNGAQKDPKFVVVHHTSNKERKHTPALHRFLQSTMASSNFLIADNGTIFYLVKLTDMSYHATVNTVLPLAVRRFLNLESKWLKVPGIEVAGNGLSKLFTSEALEATIVLQRLMVAYFDGSIKEVKSHRFFSPSERRGDPGPTSFLPLIEHAVFNDIDLMDEDYWLDEYDTDQVMFANQGSIDWIEKLNLKSRDEWWNERNKMRGKITGQWVL